MTHDYRRNGTPDLFAALDVGTGEVLLTSAAPTPGAIPGVLPVVDGDVGPGLDVQVIVDNLSTHKIDRSGTGWTKEAPPCHLHFTPTSSSW